MMRKVREELDLRYTRDSQHFGQIPQKRVYDNLRQGHKMKDDEWRVVLYGPKNVICTDVKVTIEADAIIIPKVPAINP